MQKISAVGVTVIMSLVSARYCWLIYDREIAPTLTTWLLFETGVMMSLVMHLSDGKKNLISNITNLVDTVTVTSILTSMLVMHDRIRLDLNWVDIGCLIAAIAVGAMWAKTQKHKLAHSLIQVVMTIAYFPTIYGLWTAEKNTESIGTWSAMFIACILGVYSSLAGKERDWLAFSYTSRSVIMVGLMLILMLRFV